MVNVSDAARASQTLRSAPSSLATAQASVDVAVEVDPYESMARAMLPEGHDTQIRLAALNLWEKSLTTDGPPQLGAASGRLTGYVAALAACSGASFGPASAAVSQTLSQLAPEELIVTASNGFSYLNGGLTARELFDTYSQVEFGGTSVRGVTCTGLWNDEEAMHLDAALEKLEGAVPHLMGKLQGVVVQTWIGTKDLDQPHRSQVFGNVDDHSPGILKLSRQGLKGDRLQDFLFHEFAHLADAKDTPDRLTGARFASELQSEFRGNTKPVACVSDYARTAPSEDFAETFAYCVKNKETILAHPDVYFHGLGQLSAKLSSVFSKQFGMEVPPPSPAWEAFKGKLFQGESPFGFVSDKPKGAFTHARHALKDLAIDGSPADIAARIAKEPAGPYRDQLQFLHAELFGGPTAPTISPPTIGKVASDLAKYGALEEEREAIKAGLESSEKACRSYAAPSEVPANRAGHAGLKFGERAMSLRSKLGALDESNPLSWQASLEKGLDDPTLASRLSQCQDFVAVKACAEQRMDELMEFFSQLSSQEKTSGVPQERELLYTRLHAVEADIATLKPALKTLVQSAQSDLKKALSKELANGDPEPALAAFARLETIPAPAG